MAKQKKSRPRITACGRSGIRFSAGLVKQIVDKLGHIPERFSVELYDDKVVLKPDRNGSVKVWKVRQKFRGSQVRLGVGAKVIEHALEIGCSVCSVEVLEDGSVVWYGRQLVVNQRLPKTL